MSIEKTKKKIKIIQGRVVSDKMDKTSVILVEMIKKHPVISKALRRSRKVHVHDEKNECKPGDLVRAIETRPFSRKKRHRLHSIVEKAK